MTTAPAFLKSKARSGNTESSRLSPDSSLSMVMVLFWAGLVHRNSTDNATASRRAQQAHSAVGRDSSPLVRKRRNKTWKPHYCEIQRKIQRGFGPETPPTRLISCWSR